MQEDIISEVVLHRVGFLFFFQKVKPCSRKPVSIHFKSEVVLGYDDFTFCFFFCFFFTFSFIYIFLNFYYLVFLKYLFIVEKQSDILLSSIDDFSISFFRFGQNVLCFSV